MPATTNKQDEYEPAPIPAILVKYTGDSWNEAIKRFYSDNPELRQKPVSIILMLATGKFQL